MLDSDEEVGEFVNRIMSSTLSRNIAEADRFVCLLISLFTRKSLPSGSFINGYPDAVVDWVFADVANGL